MGAERIPGLVWRSVETAADVTTALEQGSAARATGATAMNAASLRSHALLAVRLAPAQPGGAATTLHLVDLAGSERVVRSEVAGQALKEAGAINRSLAALGDVVSALQRRAQHVPFRNSRLTQVLQDSLCGSSKVLLVADLAPEAASVAETLGSLSFAARAAKVELGCARHGAAAAGAGAQRGIGGCGPAQAVWLWPFSLIGRGRRRKAAGEGRKRVMVLMSDTGGGHRASAEALKAGFQKLYGDKYEVDYVDIWSHYTPYPFNQIPRSYSFMVAHPALWKFNYYLQQPRWVHVSTQRAWAPFVSRQVAQAFVEFEPDLVVSVHPLMQIIPQRVLAACARERGVDPAPFATVVTDLTTCHNTWFHRGVDRCFVPTETCRSRALRMGLRPDQVVLHGLPIRPAFSDARAPQRVLRKRLGMDSQLPAVLLVGGGEGMGAIEATLEAIATACGGACQVVAICGRNKKLARRLQNRHFPGGMRVLVKGFVSNMADWMSACNVIVTKAGPGTIAEALICGLPIVLNGFIPCQEFGNVEYVVDNGYGRFERHPERIAAQLSAWFSPSGREELDAIAKRCAQAGKQFQFALFRIVEDLAAMVEAPRMRVPAASSRACCQAA
ncbi:hypothetical protein WJX81_007551 [Elliptochloris bilobata]|uniref:monogalactosyldiacylglycerol synthase n=1 Tax=Elliptochloris bilobata TaxID=381761 RepID=A0AAW1S4G8_9CHLO